MSIKKVNILYLSLIIAVIMKNALYEYEITTSDVKRKYLMPYLNENNIHIDINSLIKKLFTQFVPVLHVSHFARIITFRA